MLRIGSLNLGNTAVSPRCIGQKNKYQCTNHLTKKAHPLIIFFISNFYLLIWKVDFLTLNTSSPQSSLLKLSYTSLKAIFLQFMYWPLVASKRTCISLIPCARMALDPGTQSPKSDFLSSFVSIEAFFQSSPLAACSCETETDSEGQRCKRRKKGKYQIFSF